MRVAGRIDGPDQRFLGVLDTSPFRIAVVFSIAFACGAAALLLGVDFAVSRVVDGSTDNLIEAEVQGLREQVLVLSRADFIELIEQRSQDQDVRGAVYLMVDPQLRPVAGNVPAWPKIDASEGKWIQFKVSVPYGDTTRQHEMRAQRFPLPGKYQMLVGHDVQERQDVKNLMMRGLIAAVLLTLMIGMGGGIWMGRRILAQAGAISAVATQIMRGDLSQRLPVRDADDEISTLAREINSMLDKIEQLTLGMRTVLDSAAHDLRTPLNRLQATAEGAMDQLAPGSAERRVLERVTSEVDRMRSTLDALLRIALAETGTVAREQVDLSALVASMVELYAPVGEERGIALESSGRARAPTCREAGSCSRRRLRTCWTMPSSSRPTAATSACCCADPPRSRKWWWRTTGRAFRPTSARSSWAAACAWTRRANSPAPDSGCRWWPRSPNCTAHGWCSTTPQPGLRVSLKFYGPGRQITRRIARRRTVGKGRAALP